MAKEELALIKNIDELKKVSARRYVTLISIDFRLNVEVRVNKKQVHLKSELKEEVEFIRGLSMISHLLERYDLSYLIVKNGVFSFKRSKFYRPLVNKVLH